MPKSKTSAKVDESKTAKQPEPEAKKAPAKSVKAVFVPVGHVNVHLETPSGNDYNLVPREVFTIKAEDVEWFFTIWDWGFRQRLVLAADYHPTCGYHDPKDGITPIESSIEVKAPAKEPIDVEAKAKVEAPAGVEAKAETDSGEKE